MFVLDMAVVVVPSLFCIRAVLEIWQYEALFLNVTESENGVRVSV